MCSISLIRSTIYLQQNELHFYYTTLSDSKLIELFLQMYLVHFFCKCRKRAASIIVASIDDGGTIGNCESIKFSKFDLEVELTEPSTWLKQSGTGLSGYYKTSIISIFCCIEKHNIESSKSFINVALIKGEEIPSLKPIRMVPL